MKSYSNLLGVMAILALTTLTASPAHAGDPVSRLRLRFGNAHAVSEQELREGAAQVVLNCTGYSAERNSTYVFPPSSINLTQQIDAETILQSGPMRNPDDNGDRLWKFTPAGLTMKDSSAPYLDSTANLHVLRADADGFVLEVAAYSDYISAENQAHYSQSQTRTGYSVIEYYDCPSPKVVRQ